MKSKAVSRLKKKGMKFEIPRAQELAGEKMGKEHAHEETFTDQHKQALLRVLEAHRACVQVYNRAGKFLFQGSLGECLAAWQAGRLGGEENLGGIADASGVSILRFGPGDEHGFTHRKWINPLFSAISEEYQQGAPSKEIGVIREKPQIHSEITWQPTELGFSGAIIADGKDVGHFSLWKASEGKMYVHDIQIGYDEDAPRGRGIGFQIYQQIIEKLRTLHLQLVSTDFQVSQTSISPQALRVWEKLEHAGYVRRTGVTTGKIYDRFGSRDSVAEIPTYESI